MRRLWAHIIILFTAIVAVFAFSPNLVKQISTNGNYEQRRQFTFQLTQREAQDEDDDPKEINENSAKDMAKIMESRLIKYGVTEYEITTSGSDIINVTFNADEYYSGNNEDNQMDQYQQIVNVLSFSGSFALVNSNNDLVEGDQFIRGRAYLKDVQVNEYPTVILPIKTDSTEWEALIDGAIKNPESETSGEGEEETTTEICRLYLLYNWQKGDTYTTLSESGKLSSKILLNFEFAPDNPDELFYDDNKNSLAQVCGFSDSNSNGVADPSEVKAAFNQADYLLNLFHASALDYEVKCIRGLSGTEMYVDAKVEEVISYSKINWNHTLTAVLAGIIITSLLMVVFYKLGALNAAATTLLSVFLAFLFMVKAGLEYNTLAVVGLVVVAVISLVSNIIYLNKLKDEAYKGRLIKKANAEASKKSLLPILDIHIVAVAISLMCYLLGGDALHSFSSVFLLGSLVSLVLNTLGTKGSMWLATNATGLTGKYEFFGIDSEHVPNHLAEEKQTYFGNYAEKDFGKSKKPVAIVASVLFVASVVGMIVSGVVNNGNMLKPVSSEVTGNEIYLTDTIKVINEDSKSKLDDSTCEDLLSYVYIQKDKNTPIDQSNPATYVTLGSYVSSYKSFTQSEQKTVESITTTYQTTYYVVTLKSVLDKNATTEVKDYVAGDPMTLDFVLENLFEMEPSGKFSSENTKAELKKIETYVNKADTDWSKVMLATSIAIAIATVYLLIRYRLSRGLASIVFPVLTSATVMGLLILLSLPGLAIPSAAFVALPITTLLTYFFVIIFANKEREMIVEERNREDSIEYRLDVSKRALGISYTPILIAAVVASYLFINFFGFGPASASYIYLVGLIGFIITLVYFSILYVPVSNFFYKLFKGVQFPKLQKKAKKEKPKQKSAEPEEAIFIGIND